MKAKKLDRKVLDFVWKICCKLYADGDKLYAEGTKLRAEGSRLYVEGTKLRNEGSKLYVGGTKLRAEGSRRRAEGIKRQADGDKLRAESFKFWGEAVLEFRGNITIECKYTNRNYECVLGSGERFKRRRREQNP